MDGKVIRHVSNAVIYLVRHGETEWNATGRYQGGMDSPLTPRGVRQAEACGRKLMSITGRVDGMHASPLGRVRHTTAILRSYRDYPAVQWDARLKEVSVGSWDGLTDVDIEACWPGRLDGSTPFDWFFRSPDGESYDNAMARVRSWLNEVTGTIVVVSHGLTGRLIRGAYLGLGREDALSLPVPQDVIWVLSDGRVCAIEP